MSLIERLTTLYAALSTASKSYDGEAVADAIGQLEAMQAEIDRLREALTPSAETKAAYIGEFSFDISTPEYSDWTIDVPWTTIKEIMAAISARASLDRQGKRVTARAALVRPLPQRDEAIVAACRDALGGLSASEETKLRANLAALVRSKLPIDDGVQFERECFEHAAERCIAQAITAIGSRSVEIADATQRMAKTLGCEFVHRSRSIEGERASGIREAAQWLRNNMGRLGTNNVIGATEAMMLELGVTLAKDEERHGRRPWNFDL